MKDKRVGGYKNGFENFYHPEVVNIKHEPDNWFEKGEFQVTQESDKGVFEVVVLIRVNRED